jgi:hypothetical protein
MPGTVKRPSFDVTVADGGMILIKQTDGIGDDRPVVAIHPADVLELIEQLSKLGTVRQERDGSDT